MEFKNNVTCCIIIAQANMIQEAVSATVGYSTGAALGYGGSSIVGYGGSSIVGYGGGQPSL